MISKFLNDKKVNSCTFFITSKCNLTCEHCFAIKEGKDWEIKIEEYKNIIFELEKLGLKQVFIIGGEPTVHPKVIEFVEFAKKRNLFVRLVTNGINNKSFDKFKNLDLDILNISLESMNMDINDSIRGKNHFKKAIDSIALAKKIGLKIRVTITVSKVNYNDVLESMKKLEDLHIDQVKIHYYMSKGRAIEENSITPHEWISLCSKLSKERFNYTFTYPIMFIEKERYEEFSNKNFKCDLLEERLNLSYYFDNKIYGCCFLLGTENYIFEFKNDIFNKNEENLSDLDLAFLNKNEIGCPLKNKIYNNNILESEEVIPVCIMFREKIVPNNSSLFCREI